MQAAPVRKIERPKGVSELVLERLREDIIHNRFALGERVSEAQLSELYGVTKAPIRSAYIRLASEGLLEIRPQSGTYIFRPDVRELAAMCELRAALELEAISLALARRPADLAGFVRDVVVRMDAALGAGDHAAYHRLDGELHLGFFEMAELPLLQSVYAAHVHGRFSALRYRFSTEESLNEVSIREHHAIRDAVAEGGAARLRALLRAHIEMTKSYYEGFLG